MIHPRLLQEIIEVTDEGEKGNQGEKQGENQGEKTQLAVSLLTLVEDVEPADSHSRRETTVPIEALLTVIYDALEEPTSKPNESFHGEENSIALNSLVLPQFQDQNSCSETYDPAKYAAGDSTYIENSMELETTMMNQVTWKKGEKKWKRKRNEKKKKEKDNLNIQSNLGPLVEKHLRNEDMGHFFSKDLSPEISFASKIETEKHGLNEPKHPEPIENQRNETLKSEQEEFVPLIDLNTVIDPNPWVSKELDFKKIRELVDMSFLSWIFSNEIFWTESLYRAGETVGSICCTQKIDFQKVYLSEDYCQVEDWALI